MFKFRRKNKVAVSKEILSQECLDDIEYMRQLTDDILTHKFDLYLK
jgi:hypothetical protein